MNTNLLKLVLCVQTLSTLSGCLLAQAVGVSTPITVRALVHDPDGKPVEGATVGMALPRYRPGEPDVGVTALTDREGIATVSGPAQQDYGIDAKKSGYYPTRGPHRGINTEQGFARYATGTQQIDLELRPIKNPIHSIAKRVERLRLPAMQGKFGFDLEIGDWVAPHGRGRTADLVFTLEGHYNSMTDYDQTLRLTFSNPGDGIIYRQVTPRLGSSFKHPYEAPLAGYAAQRVWHAKFDGTTRVFDSKPNDETDYIIRVRSQSDARGNVRQALYGVIGSEILLGGNNQAGQIRGLSFGYALNPDWTRNLEFDEKQRVEAGTGKLLVAPPPQ